MPSVSLTLTRLLLAALTLLGAVTLQVFARRNTLFEQMAHASTRHQLATPGGILSSPLTYDPHFTGLGPLDKVLGVMLMFFWTVVDGSSVRLSAVGFAFAGQTVATWTVTMVESVRMGNRARTVSYTAIWGIAAQLVGLGLCGPLYLLVHTLTTPFFLPALGPDVAAAATAAPGHRISTVPAAVTLGYVLPTVLFCLPAPDVLPLWVKLQAHNAWQGFPIGCALAHFLLSAVWPRGGGTGGGGGGGGGNDDVSRTRDRLRWVYKFALSVAAPAHLAATALTLCAWIFPDLFASRFVGELQPGNVFVPTARAFEAGVKAASIAEGALWFIQWDYLIVGAAYLAWAAAARGQVGGGLGVGDLLTLAWRVCVLGPTGAALATIWERDEIVFETVLEGRRKKGL